MDLLLHQTERDGKLSFSVRSERVAGLSQLVQEVVIELLSDYDQTLDRGANLARNLSDVIEADQAGAERAVEEALRAARSHLFARQQANSSLRPDERLRALELLSVVPAGVRLWKIELSLTNMRGDSTAVALPETTGG